MMDVIEPVGYGEAFNGFCDMKCGVIRIAVSVLSESK